MKLHFLLFSGAALLAAASSAQAVPTLLPLLKPSPMLALLPAPAPVPLLLPAATVPAADPDPSLNLASWRQAFNIAALGAFDIPLRSDPAERINILLSAQAVDNTVLAPGEEFSFNRQVGERTLERGYQDGLMFDNGQIVRGTGGGICLVATGLYNAALEAGLTITERCPHSGVVGYAPPGCDAGIVYGSKDLRFVNSTDRPLVIQARAEEDHVAVRLFGQTPPPEQRVVVKPVSLTVLPASTVTQTDPILLPGERVVQQKPRAGYDVVVARFWTEHGRVVRREIVAREHRAPRPEVVRVAPPVAPAVSEGSAVPHSVSVDSLFPLPAF